MHAAEIMLTRAKKIGADAGVKFAEVIPLATATNKPGRWGEHRAGMPGEFPVDSC